MLFRSLGVKVVAGFTGSSIWPYLYSFPPNPPELVPNGYRHFAEMWNPILNVFDEVGVRFALEAHPTEIAFDIASAEAAVLALGGRKSFGFNYDPSHFVYQNVDYVGFLQKFADRIYHVHMKMPTSRRAPPKPVCLAAILILAMRAARGTSARWAAGRLTLRL